MQNTTNPYEALLQRSLNGRLNTTSMNLASKGQRLGAYVIDSVVLYILIFTIAFITGLLNNEQKTDDAIKIAIKLAASTIVSIVVIAYYTIQEAGSGQTIGKRMMKIKVVSLDNEPISGSQAFGRALCRFIPFEALSIFFTDTMWHDSIPKTKVISLK